MKETNGSITVDISKTLLCFSISLIEIAVACID